MLHVMCFGVTKIVNYGGEPENKDVVSGKVAWVTAYSICSPEKSPPAALVRSKCFPSGSWKRIYLTQPPCAIKWIMCAPYKRIDEGMKHEAVVCGDLWSEELFWNREPATLDEYSEYVKKLHASR